MAATSQLSLYTVRIIRSNTEEENIDKLYWNVEEANTTARHAFTDWTQAKGYLVSDEVSQDHDEGSGSWADLSYRWGTEGGGMGWWEGQTHSGESIQVRVIKHELERPEDMSAQQVADGFEVDSATEQDGARRGRKRKADGEDATDSITTDFVVGDDASKRRKGRTRNDMETGGDDGQDTVGNGDEVGEAGEATNSIDDSNDRANGSSQEPKNGGSTKRSNRWAEEPRRQSARLRQIAQDPPPPPPLQSAVEAKKSPIKKKAEEAKSPETPEQTPGKRGRKPTSDKVTRLPSAPVATTPLQPPRRNTRTTESTPTTTVSRGLKPGRDFPTFTWKVNQDHPPGEPVQIPHNTRNDLESHTFKWRINEPVRPIITPMIPQTHHLLAGSPFALANSQSIKPKSSTEHLPLFCFPAPPPNARLIVLGCHPACQAFLQPALELKARQVLEHFPEAMTMKDPLRVYYNGGYFLEHIPAETICGELRKLHAGKPHSMVFSIAKGGHIVSFNDLTEEEVRAGMAWVARVADRNNKTKVTLGFPAGFDPLQMHNLNAQLAAGALGNLSALQGLVGLPGLTAGGSNMNVNMTAGGMSGLPVTVQGLSGVQSMSGVPVVPGGVQGMSGVPGVPGVPGPNGGQT